MNRRITMMVMLVMFAATPLTARAEEGDKRAILKRMKARLPEIAEYKKAEKLGEGWDGLIDAVKKEYLKDKNDKRLPKLLDEENKDRKRFFEIVAKEQETSPTIVAQKWAKKAFERAKPGEWLKMIDKEKKEHWVRKKKKDE